MVNTHTRLFRAGSHAATSSRMPVSAFLLMAAPILRVVCERDRPSEQFAAVDASAMLQIAFIAIAGFWVLYRLKHTWHEVQQLALSRPLVYLAAYLVLAGSSTAWSTHRTLTFYRFIEACVYFGLLIDILVTVRDVQRAFLILMIYLTFVIAAFYIILFRARILGGEPMTVLFKENIGGLTAATGLFLSATFIKCRRSVFRLWCCFFIVAVILTNSLATYVAVLTAGSLAILFRGSKKLWGVACFIICVIVVAGTWLGPATLLSRTILFNKPTKNVKTATGRLRLWESYREDTMRDSLLIGRGYEAGEHQARGTGYISNAHNAFIAAVVSLGLPGLFLTVLLAGSMICAAAYIPGNMGMALLAASICTWINSLTAPSISSRVRASWVAMAFLCILITGIKNGLISNRTKCP